MDGIEIPREIAKTILNAAKDYPVVTITGPRQVGKTTLVRYLFPDRPYVNLEDPDTRSFALNDPRRFIFQFTEGVIIDEVQHAPLLLSYIQVIVDETHRNGQFILTGSQQLDLHAAVSQSLAGRTALVSMLPLTIAELQNYNILLSVDDYLLTGFLPRIYANKIDAKNVYRNYVMTYLERDVRNMTKVHDLSLFQKFLYLCAGRVGQILNQSSLANDVGVSTTTIQHWLSILEASYLIFRLQPYYENFGKRMIKAAKLYFFDVGLVSFLLGIETSQQMFRDPMRGHLFENMVVLECIKTRINQGLSPNLFYYRDSHHNAIDLIYKKAQQLIPIEIKSSESVDPSFVKQLRYFQQLAPDKVSTGYIVYAGNLEYDFHNFALCSYKNCHQIVKTQED